MTSGNDNSPEITPNEVNQNFQQNHPHQFEQLRSATLIEPNLDELIALQNQFYRTLETDGKSENTIKNYRTDLDCFNRYLRIHQQKISLTQIDLPKILHYGTYLQEKYQSDNSRRRRVQALRIFFDFLVSKGLVHDNFVKQIPTSPKFLDRPKPTPFSDVKTLWVYLLELEKNAKGLAKVVVNRNQLIFCLIFGGGLKVSDISKLRRDNITLGENPKILVTPPKRDPYTVRLPEVVNHVAVKYFEALDQQKNNQDLKFDDLLFNANPYRILSGKISARGLEILFEELRTKLVLHLTPKSLRQACIYKWLHQGHPESLIKEWMGVAPSYSMKPYRDSLKEHLYNDEFLLAIYQESHFVN